MEAEIGVVQPQAKEPWSHQKRDEARNSFPLEPVGLLTP